MKQQFWDSNPCGLIASWEQAREIRFKYTDPYLRRYLNERYFADRKVLEVECGQGLDATEILKYCRSYEGFKK
jgi:hypothetical protein